MLLCSILPAFKSKSILFLERLGRIANVDVAPALAELPGVKLPQPDGRVLRERLR
jgi:hypothetical protein